MRKILNMFILASCFLYLSNTAVFAEYICKVTDPTGTPLNVRDSPNGNVVRQLKNGTRVFIREYAEDSQGRAWEKISVIIKGKNKIIG